jgi:hypothetical protein
MVGWRAIALRVESDVRNSVGAVLADDQAQQAPAARQVTDGPSLLGTDPAGDELADLAPLVADAERRVLSTNELAHPVDDELEDLLDVEHAADAADRGVERLKRRRKRRLSSWRINIARHVDGVAIIGRRRRLDFDGVAPPDRPGAVRGR